MVKDGLTIVQIATLQTLTNRPRKVTRKVLNIWDSASLAGDAQEDETDIVFNLVNVFQ